MKRFAAAFCVLVLTHNAFSQKSNIDYPNPGSIHPNAKHLDADQLYPFSHGAAILIKGNSHALIDSSGNLVVPFNKFRFWSARPYLQTTDKGILDIGRANGILLASSASSSNLYHTQMITPKGKVIYTAPAGYQLQTWDGPGSSDEDAPLIADVFSINKKITDNTKSLPYTGVSSDGSVTSFKKQYSFQWGDGLYAYLDDNLNKWGYKDRKGTVVIKPQYESVSTFSEGLAAVAKKDEFKELKWGYINKQGAVVIPFKYSNQPGDFGEGLAVVTPKTITDFKYAFIDQTGEVKITIPADSPLQNLADYQLASHKNKFVNGFIFCRTTYPCLMSKKQMVYDEKSILNWFGLNTESSKLQFFPFYNGQMYYRQGNKYGLLNLQTITKVPAIFNTLSMFDPVSNLAYAKLAVGKDQNNKEQYIEGYINRQGVFVMVKKTGTTW